MIDKILKQKNSIDFLSKMLIKSNIVFLLFCFTSCNNAEDYLKVRSDLSEVSFTTDVNINLDSIYKQIPDYSHVVQNISKTNHSFDDTDLINPENASKYVNSKQVSLMYGMYSANLVYVRHFERVQLCMDYMDAVRILAERLAVSTSDFNNLVPELESSLYDNKRFFHITDSILNEGQKWFSEPQLISITSLFWAGLWLEALFLGIRDVNLKCDTVKETIYQHFEILSLINKILSSIDDGGGLINELTNEMSLLENKGYENEHLKEELVKLRKKYIK